MKFTVGYPLEERDAFVGAVQRNADCIDEVYFPWPGVSSGRSVQGERGGYVDWGSQQQLLQDLLSFKSSGLKLNLLLNGNCHGAGAISEHFQNTIRSILDFLDEQVGGIDSVTTASPFVAHVVKERGGAVAVRASVNMRIGTIAGMEYVVDLFDEFCVQREHNRDLRHLQQLSAWAASSGKFLTLLVNSGCLNYCSNQSFHDNLVAHEAELSAVRNVSEFDPIRCVQFLGGSKNAQQLLYYSNWVRPEDICHYEGLFHVLKLATRLHSRPDRVIDAYAGRSYRGNTLDLFEPGVGRLLHPYILDNSKFPEDWFEGYQNRLADDLGLRSYCRAVLDAAKVRVPDWATVQ
jgi:hypothetical protein